MPLPALSAPVASLAGNLLGGIFSAKSARKQNREAAKQAQLNRDFQERMSSTAYQRATKDLQKAGLNRILALGSPSSSPGGAQAPVVGELEGAATSARAAAMDVANILNIKAQTAKTIAETSFTKSKESVIKPAATIFGKAGDLLQRGIEWLEADGNIAGILTELKKIAGTLTNSAKEQTRIVREAYELITTQYTSKTIKNLPTEKGGKILKLDSDGLPYLNEDGTPVYIGK